MRRKDFFVMLEFTNKPISVDVLTHWLYTGQLPESRDHKEWNRVAGELSEQTFDIKIKAFAFADRFCVSELRRLLHNSLVAEIELSE